MTSAAYTVTDAAGTVLARGCAAAEAEIFAAVIAARWPRHPEAVPDAEYDAWVADALADAAA